MILDEIKKYYFRQKLTNETAVSLEISQKTFEEMRKQDPTLIKVGLPNDNGELPPLLGRPVKVIDSNNFAWRWICHS
jgi:hypothetical protein